MSFRRWIEAFAAVMLVLVLFSSSASRAAAHEPGTSALLLDIGDSSVEGEVQLPLDRLEIAVELPLVERRDSVVDLYGEVLQAYIAEHLSVVGADGTNTAGVEWELTLFDLAVEPIDGVDHLTANVEVVPPSGAMSDFTVHADLVLDRLLSHSIVVVAGPVGSDRSVVGTLDYASQHVGIEIGAIDRSFASVLWLGFDHVVIGADHLLFLFVLLLPAPLRSKAGSWERAPFGFAGSMLRVVQVATAFALGHSLTLAATSVGWFNVPSGPVEVLIAASIAVGALHAWRPMIAYGEIAIAGGFGLVHGLAFAGILEGYGLDGGSSVAPLLAFNLGVEVAQLATVFLVFPPLYVLSRTRFYGGVRAVSAALAFLAALGWFADRSELMANPFATIEDWAIEHLSVIVAALTLGALAALLVERWVPRFAGPGLASAPAGRAPLGDHERRHGG